MIKNAQMPVKQRSLLDQLALEALVRHHRHTELNLVEWEFEPFNKMLYVKYEHHDGFCGAFGHGHILLTQEDFDKVFKFDTFSPLN